MNKYRAYIVFNFDQPLLPTIARTEKEVFENMDNDLLERYYAGIEGGRQSLTIKKVLIEPVNSFKEAEMTKTADELKLKKEIDK